MLPRWFWRVRFQTANGGGETLTVAPHRAAAKQAIAASPEHVMAYESAEPLHGVPIATATQYFDGYYPRIRAVMAAIRSEWL